MALQTGCRANDGRRPDLRASRAIRVCSKIVLAALIGSGTLLTASISVAGATTTSVTNCADSGTGSLRDAISGATSGTTINFALSCSTILDLTTPMAINTNVTITGPGEGALSVSGNNATEVFQVGSNANVSISGLTIENGSSSTGGAINNAGVLRIYNATLVNNSSTAGGGAIFNTGSLTLSNTTVTNNTDGSTEGGGGIANEETGTANISSSTISGNHASSGSGGGVSNQGILDITTSLISNNTASVEGGGVFDGTPNTTAPTSNGGSSDAGSTVTSPSYVIPASDTSPSFTAPGAPGSSSSTNPDSVNASNSTLYGNTAAAGGGIANDPGTVTLRNDTLVGNKGAPGGNAYNAAGSTMNLTATLFAGPQSGGNCSGTVADHGYNVDDDGTCAFASPSISNSSNLMSKLGPLADNGGPTQTIAVLAGFPGIDYVASQDCPSTDQRLLPRTTPCDIGAYDSDATGGPAPVLAESRSVVLFPVAAIGVIGGAFFLQRRRKRRMA